ncbi:MAG: hypothetical protein HY660_14360 [Armatimonadetes bacterium]|nr:hypothetical protein [Armatimonadota bacterium]
MEVRRFPMHRQGTRPDTSIAYMMTRLGRPRAELRELSAVVKRNTLAYAVEDPYRGTLLEQAAANVEAAIAALNRADAALHEACGAR